MNQRYMLLDMRTREHLIELTAASDTDAAKKADQASTPMRRVVASLIPDKLTKRRKTRATK